MLKIEIVGFISRSRQHWRDKLASVFLVPGTNLHSVNPDNDFIHNSNLPRLDIASLFDELIQLEDIENIVVSGGEPTLQKRLEDFLWEMTDYGYKVKIDSNGTNPWVLGDLVDEDLVDCLSITLKQDLTKSKYGKIVTSNVSIRSIQESIAIALNSDLENEFVLHYTPGLISKEDVFSLARKLKGADRFVLKYVPMKKEAEDAKTIDKMISIAKHVKGIKDVIVQTPLEEKLIYGSAKISLY